MTKLQVGNRVCGKSKRHMGKIGRILRVLKESRQHTYDVQWTNGAVDIVSARSISVDPAFSRFEYGVASEGSTFLELLGSADDHNQDNLVCESSSSDGEEGEDDAVDSVENSESEGGDTVTAHGRLWVSCDAILVDQATQFSSRAIRFLWPAYLQLGEPTLVKYFYLMYSSGRLQHVPL
ncbi:hypothetical protein AM587_10011837 [Phytophthora nicotianae]|uniref:Uncharacterized protein n=1 Tax=Phytophthora nicotianae TaxID=4792 RepID=A0A0W8C817_PHYNI|nr:hypothetical protein AM587_10011837 [Phytophthora nicotianae]